MNDPGGISAVEETFAALTKAFEHFCDVHQQYHELIEDEDDVDISQCYFEKAECEFTKIKSRIDQFTEEQN